MSETNEDTELSQLKKRTKRLINITKGIKMMGIGLVLIGLVLGLWAFWLEPSSIVVNKTEITLPKWHKEHSNFRIAILTDLHIGSPNVGLEKLDLIVSKTNQEKPDLVVLLGDFVITGVGGGTFVEPELIAQGLKKLQAPQGVVAVLGNHDWWYNGERVRQALEKEGISVLENSAIKITKSESSFWVAGLAEVWTRKPDVAKTLETIKDDNPVIMLTHNPDIFPQIPERVGLTLAGHTHGGQVNFPIIGRPRIPSAFGQRFAIGHIVENNHHLFVSSGVGTSIIPVRFRVPPEIALLTINQTPQL